LTKRSFDGQAFGPVSEVDLYYGSADGRNTFVSDLPKVSGMFFDKVHGRLYYTMRGDSRLLWRGFSPQSDVVGPMPFAAPGDVGALDPGSVQGMFLSGDRLYFADGAEGKLWSVGFADGGVVGPKVLVDESMDWRARGAFAWNGTPAPGPNVPPIAVIGSDCTGLTCDFRSADSTDPDGSIVARAWDFGDGATSTAANPKHTYDDEGSYAVKLTVTDNRGGETTSEVEVTVTRPENVVPVAVFSESCSGLVCSFDGSGSSDPDGDGIVGFAWDFGDGGSATGERPGHEFAAAGDYEVSLTVTDGRGGTGSVTRTVTVSDPVASQVAFRDRATYSGNVTTARIRVPASVRAGDGLLLFVSNASGLTPTSVTSGWSLVGQRSLTNLRSQLFVLTATASSAGSEVVVVLPSRAKVDLTMLAYSGTAADAPVGAWAAVTETALTASHVAPALPVGTTSSWVLSYWVDRTSSGAGTWTAPGDAVTRSTLAGTGGGKLSSLAVDYGTAVPQGTWPAKTAVAELASRAAVMWTVELRSS
jgi:PKD repeat protein